MNKRQLATLVFQARQLDQMVDAAIQTNIDIISKAFSDLATMDPKIALHVIDQMNNQRSNIESVQIERDEQQQEFVKEFVSKVSDQLDEDGNEDLN